MINIHLTNQAACQIFRPKILIISRYSDKRLSIVDPQYDSSFFTTCRNRTKPHGLLDHPVSTQGHARSLGTGRPASQHAKWSPQVLAGPEGSERIDFSTAGEASRHVRSQLSGLLCVVKAIHSHVIIATIERPSCASPGTPSPFSLAPRIAPR
jgi:hypothetical protein